MLLIGPPGSGKTHFVLTRLEAAIREGRVSLVKLIVPTASMAQHTLHTLARRGLVVPGEVVATMADFVAGLTPALKTPSAAVESWLLKRAIGGNKPGRIQPNQDHHRAACGRAQDNTGVLGRGIRCISGGPLLEKSPTSCFRRGVS